MKLKKPKIRFDAEAREKQWRAGMAVIMIDKFIASGEKSLAVVPELGDNISALSLALVLQGEIDDRNRMDDAYAGIRVHYAAKTDEAILYRAPEL